MNQIVKYHNPGLLGRTIFDELFGDFQTLAKRSTQGYPVADIFANENGDTVLEFALAGFSKDDLTIDVQPERAAITVRANTEGCNEEQDRRVARRSFQKTFVNHDNKLDFASATATFVNGLLTVTVPKKAESEPIKIKIN
jgi:HSP20 family molecular chaperone IbpA